MTKQIFQNNNKQVIRNLALKLMKKNRTQNIITIVAVVLTTVLLTTVFSVGASFIESIENLSIRLQGTKASIAVDRPTPDQYEAVSRLSYIKAAGLFIEIGSVKNQTEYGKETRIGLVYHDKSDFENHIMPAIDEIHGNYPVKKNELMLSDRALSQLGIAQPEIGMPITLRFETMEELLTDEFIISGWYTSYGADTDLGYALASQEYCVQNGYVAQKTGRVMVSVGLGQQQKIKERITNDIDLREDQLVIAAGKGSQNTGDLRFAATAIAAIIAILFVLCGYLLIYNIQSISVDKETRFYGLLKTIGVSPKQIKRIVSMRLYYLGAIGIPLGLTIGAVLSYLIIPKIIDFLSSIGKNLEIIISFHPTIYIFATLFTFFTLYTSCRLPAKKAAEISPVEAVKYVSISVNRKQRRKKTNRSAGLFKMAWHNVFRSKKRAALVFTSLFLGLIVLLGTHSIINAIFPDDYVNTMITHDFTYEITLPFEEKFPEAFIQKIYKMDGILNVERTETEFCLLPYDTDLFAPVLLSEYQRYFSGPDTSYEDFISDMSEKDFGTYVHAIDEHYIVEFNEAHGDIIDLEAFRRGDIGIIGYGYNGSYDSMIGKELTLECVSNGNKKTIQIGGVFRYYDCGRAGYLIERGMPDGFFVSKNFMKTLSDNPITTSILINASQEKEPEIRMQLEENNKILPFQSFAYHARSVFRGEFTQITRNIKLISGGTSGILIFIGLLNFVNITVTSIWGRRSELAVMESIGMTGKQVRAMLIFEGSIYAMVTCGLLLTIGSFVLTVLFYLAGSTGAYMNTSYPVGLTATMIVSIFIICIIIPIFVYRSTKDQSIVERLAETQNE